MDGAIISVGCSAPRACSSAMVLAGIKVMALVFSANNITMALEATPGCGLSWLSCSMARSPMGVAALPAPSMLAPKFMAMDPKAGCPAGTSGNTNRSSGPSARAIRWISPLTSTRRMIPIHKVIMPARGNITSITAASARFNTAAVTGSKVPVASATATEIVTIPSQI